MQNEHDTISINEISIEDAKAYIYSIDFSQIIYKMCKKSGWLEFDVLETCLQYRNFLFLKKKNPELYMVPSLDIDDFWHEHILDTKKYIEDTKAIFGHYLHHRPTFGINDKLTEEELKQKYEVTNALYHKEFGQEILATRSRYPKILYNIAYQLNRICS